MINFKSETVNSIKLCCNAILLTMPVNNNLKLILIIIYDKNGNFLLNSKMLYFSIKDY